MKIIKIAFFKGAGSPLAKAIRAVTNSKYSHSEIIMGNTWYGANINMTFSGVTRIKNPNIDLKEWDFVTISVDSTVYKKTLNTLNSLVGSPYGFFSALNSQLRLFTSKTDDDFFCSKFVVYVLNKNKVLKFKDIPDNYTPEDLNVEIKNKYKFTPKLFKKINLYVSNEDIYNNW